jgi:hypothetical protein
VSWVHKNLQRKRANDALDMIKGTPSRLKKYRIFRFFRGNRRSQSSYWLYIKIKRTRGLFYTARLRNKERKGKRSDCGEHTDE